MAEGDVNDVERPADAGGAGTAVVDPDMVEVQEIDKDGKKEKMVRLEALHSVRSQNKELKDTIAKLEPLMPEFQEFLDNKRGGGRVQAHPQQPQQRPGESDEELAELDATALALGYVNMETGEPDRNRTKQVLNILDRRTSRAVGGMTRPLAQSVQEQRATRHREDAYEKMFVDGRPVADAQYIDMAFDSLPAEYSSDPTVAGVAHLLAAGLQYLEERKGNVRGRQPGSGVERQPVRMRRGGREPMFVEGSAGRIQQDEEAISAFSEAAARARGKSPEAWQKQRERVTARKSDVLDDVY